MDLGVPLFADHIRALTASFDSKLADAGNPLVRQLRLVEWRKQGSIYTGTLGAGPTCHWLADKSKGRGLLLVCF